MHASSAWEIERWKGVLARDKANGLERMRSYVAGQILGRDWNEEMEAYLARKGMTEFHEWATPILKGEATEVR